MFCVCTESSADFTGIFYSHRVKALLAPHPTPPVGMHEKLGGTHPGQMIPADHGDIPSHKASCSAGEAGGRRTKEGIFEVMTFVF